MRLFLYGTLMRGGVAHHHVADLTRLGPAQTAPGYALYALGWYPGLVVDPQAGCVHGEVYALPDGPQQALRLAALDAYEGVPDPYTRQRITLQDGSEAVAWVLAPARAAGHPRIPHGDWRRWHGAPR